MRNAIVLAGVLVLAGMLPAALWGETAPANEISAEQGPCSAQLKVTGTDRKPVYLAKVSTRVQYGFAGTKRIDLSAYTDADGLLKITGLPEVRKKPLLIRIAKDSAEVLVEFKPEDSCQGSFNVALPVGK